MKYDEFIGAAKRLDDIDLPAIGALIGVGEDEIHAVIDAETSGSGFDSKGRPKMLFEPHIFYRLLSGEERDTAVKLGLAYKKWGQKRYPRDSYPRLMKAMAINDQTALMSASWGLGQIMGFNYRQAGYQTVYEMVRSFVNDEEAHLMAMIKFIEANGLDDELRAHDWCGFARGYNGPGYTRNKYHVKLEKAYNKWALIRDTPYDPKRPQAAAPKLDFLKILESILSAIRGGKK